ncbi:predicted protein [Uncinocarpus reesii 1704]|uniref:OTU domain-containing protein n=1 Tax=Uncinocarpus reesii (strain UAMH 1704) TaxID=336963 RepID=C4JRT7_UNCRE|nr:uncharacterized protein UREG_05176 [Uncinocarpus reesii 1704]EEP80334.1 predicted protein [Uncinocarpus reesii 1704]
MADATLPPAARIVPVMARARPKAQSAGQSALSSRRNSAAEIEVSDQRLKERLEELNCYPAETTGDGNCLFYSLSDQLYGTPDRHDEVRRRLVDHIREHRDAFIHFVDLGPNRPRSTREASRQANRLFGGVGSVPSTEKIDSKFEDMLLKMGEPHEWGGAFELQAFCQAYARDIIVYQADNVQEFTSNLHDVDPNRKTVHLAFHGYQHYSSVRSLDGPREGLPNLPRRLEGADAQFVTEEVRRHSVATQTSPTSLALAEPWKISTIAEALPGLDYDTIRAVLMKCRGDIEFAFSRLLDDDLPSSSQSPDTTTDTETCPVVPQTPAGHLNPATRAYLGASSRSSSRHSTGSKRPADLSEDDDEEPVRSGVRRRRARERKRRVLQDVTVGISVRGDNKDDVISIQLRVDPDAVVEPPKRATTPQDDSGDDAGRVAAIEVPDEDATISTAKLERSDGSNDSTVATGSE